MLRTLFQVLPLSDDLNSPRSPPGPQSGPCAATKTMLLSRGSTTMRPMCSDFLSPIFFQLLPPSSERYTPSPYETDRWLLLSPVPTQTTEALLGSSSTQPIE